MSTWYCYYLNVYIVGGNCARDAVLLQLFVWKVYCIKNVEEKGD